MNPPGGYIWRANVKGAWRFSATSVSLSRNCNLERGGPAGAETMDRFFPVCFSGFPNSQNFGPWMAARTDRV